MCLATLDNKCKCLLCSSICSLIMVQTLIFMLLQLPLVPVLDVGKQNSQKCRNQFWFGFFSVTYSSNSFGQYLYRRNGILLWAAGVRAKVWRFSEFSPVWPVGIRCWYGFSASFVPKCAFHVCCGNATPLCLYKTQPRLLNSKTEIEFTEALLLPELRHQCS